MTAASVSARRMRRAARVLLILAVALLPSVSAFAGRLIGIRTGVHGDSLRIVFDLEGKVPRSIVPVPEGDDWVVYLRGACPSAQQPPAIHPGSCLRGIELKCEGKDLRVLLSSAGPVRAKSFSIPEGNGKPLRFVVDLTPAGAPAVRSEGESPSAAPPSESVPESVPGSVPGSVSEPVPEPVPEPAPRRSGNWRILIDPGHGGDDPGATAKGIREKEVVLDVASRVAAILNATRGFDARLSRTDDRRVPLRQRRVVAEQCEADAFVSIHVNASRARNAMGVEVFFLSIGGASDEASRELARLENEADPDWVVEEDSLLKGIPFSFDLRQSDTLVRSGRLAESILMNFESSGLAASRGVKQAGFAVLKSFQVPSALVEVGFLSNPAEAKRLKEGKHRQRLAACIAQGMVDYFGRFARAKAERQD